MPRLSFNALKTRIPDTSRLGCNQRNLQHYWDIWACDYVRDLTDTITPAYAAMTFDTDTSLALTEIPQALTAWDDAPLVTPEFTANTTTGEITVNEAMTVEFLITASVELGLLRELISRIDRGATATPFASYVQGKGITRPAGLALLSVFRVVSPPETFKTVISLETGSANVTFKAGAWIARYIPTIE